MLFKIRTRGRAPLLARNSAFLAGASYATQVLSAIAFVLVARTVTPAQLGPVLAALGLATLVAGLADLGINTLALRVAASQGPHHPTVRTGIAAKATLAVGVSVIWVVLVGLAISSHRITENATTILLMGPWAGATILYGTLLIPFRAREKMHVVAAVNVLDRLVACALTLALLASGMYAPEALSVGLLAGALTSLGVTWRILEGPLRPKRFGTAREAVRLFRESIGFALFGLAIQLERLDVIVVGLTAGPTTAGIFGAGSRMINFLNILPAAFANSVFPRVAAQATSRLRTHEFIGFLAMFGAQALLLTAVFVFADPVTTLVLGEQYAGTGEVVRVLCFGVLIVAANQPAGAYLQAVGKEFSAGIALIVAIPTGIALVGIGAALWGSVGAAFGYVGSQLIIFICFFIMACTAHAQNFALGKSTTSQS